MKKLVVDIDQLAEILNINRQTIAKHRAEVRTCSRLKNLPEPCQIRPKLLWWVADIEAWVESQRTFRLHAITAETILPAPLPAKKRKRGRPTKTERFGVAT